MFTAAALVSSPPLLIPELSGAAAAETDDLRAASVAVAERLSRRASTWTIIGVGAVDARFGPDTAGTFAGFGVDVRVGLRSAVRGAADPTLPLSLLVGGWLRAEANGHPERGDLTADGIVLGGDTPPARCAARGVDLRRRLDSDPEPHGVLVVADGATTLTTKAPGGYDDRAPGVQLALDIALAEGDVDRIARLDPVLCAELGISGRAAWQMTAGLFGARPRECATEFQGAPYGVGYHVGMWLP